MECLIHWGTREYLTCEQGQVELIAGGEHHRLDKGDMLVFRGDQRHSYVNPDKSPRVRVDFLLFVLQTNGIVDLHLRF